MLQVPDNKLYLPQLHNIEGHLCTYSMHDSDYTQIETQVNLREIVAFLCFSITLTDLSALRDNLPMYPYQFTAVLDFPILEMTETGRIW